MAKINLERRAEIGQEKRARTRAQLVAAAATLFSSRGCASVTIDDLVREAGVAKGTFYVHFDDMHALTVAVADDLISSFDELIQPQRASTPEPLLRIAFGCDAFIEKALEDPAWASLVARMARSYPTVGETARSAGGPSAGSQGIAALALLRGSGAGSRARRRAPGVGRNRARPPFPGRSAARCRRGVGRDRRREAGGRVGPQEAGASQAANGGRSRATCAPAVAVSAMRRGRPSQDSNRLRSRQGRRSSVRRDRRGRPN